MFQGFCGGLVSKKNSAFKESCVAGVRTVGLNLVSHITAFYFVSSREPPKGWKQGIDNYLRILKGHCLLCRAWIKWQQNCRQEEIFAAVHRDFAVQRFCSSSQKG